MPMGIGLGIGVTRFSGVGGGDPDAAMIALFNGGVGVGGLEGAYYRVSDLTTLFEDRGGAAATTPATVNGLVGTIKDKSPNARHLTATSDAARGTLRLVGGKYYIETDGVDDGYSASNLTAGGQPFYLASADTFISGSSSNSMVFGRRHALANYVLLRSASGSRQIFARGLALASLSASASATGVPCVADGYIDASGNGAIGVNGGTDTTGALTTGVLGVLVNQLSVNLNTAGSAINFIIHWYGGLHLNSQPTTPERATIVARLAALI